jgi:hypothetical protein
VSGDNPYQEQTTANTSPTWLEVGKGEQIDVNLDGMAEFAKDMVKIQDYVNARLGHLDLLGELPKDAWQGNVLGEVGLISSHMFNNYKGFTQYSRYVAVALNNVGMAAQTISDIYGSADGWSGASLDAVNWAFGVKTAPRPGNLPAFIGKTFWERYNEAVAKGAPPENAPDWVNKDPRTNADGSVTALAIGPDGQRREITTLNQGGVTTVTTVIYDAKGAVVTQHSERTETIRQGNSVTARTVFTDASGKQVGAQEKTTTYGAGGDVAEEKHVTYGADGKPTGSTTTTTGTDKSHTEVTRDADGKVTADVRIGAATEKADVSAQSPLQQTVEEIRGHDYGLEG